MSEMHKDKYIYIALYIHNVKNAYIYRQLIEFNRQLVIKIHTHLQVKCMNLHSPSLHYKVFYVEIVVVKVSPEYLSVYFRNV